MCYTVTPKTVDTLLPPVWVFGNPGVSKHQCVFTLQCFETPGVSKHLVFGNTKTGGSRVSTIFGVSKHFFFTVYLTTLTHRPINMKFLINT